MPSTLNFIQVLEDAMDEHSGRYADTIKSKQKQASKQRKPGKT
jgi:hypothetical protein